MSGSTTELNLATAVDADDNADYLTINLANSLRTLDALFNNVTGHTHAGAHQGGPVAPASGSITSGMIQDGTIVAADLANGAVTNAKLASDTARLNLLTNGGFEIWQRGNGPFTGLSVTGADRWISTGAPGDTISISRDTTNVDAGSAACAAVTFTKGTGTTGISQYAAGGGGTENPQLAGRVVTFSIRVRTATANLARAAVHTGAAWSYGPFHTGNGTYQTLSVTVTLAAVGANMAACAVWFDGGGSGTIYLDNAMLVVGSQYADYAPLHPADDLARCLRYYEMIGVGNQTFAYQGYGAAGQAFTVPLIWKVTKATTPTVTKLGTWGVLNCPQPNIGSCDTIGGYITSTPTATGATQFFNNTTGPAITVEANP